MASLEVSEGILGVAQPTVQASKQHRKIRGSR